MEYLTKKEQYAAQILAGIAANPAMLNNDELPDEYLPIQEWVKLAIILAESLDAAIRISNRKS